MSVLLLVLLIWSFILFYISHIFLTLRQVTHFSPQLHEEAILSTLSQKLDSYEMSQRIRSFIKAWHETSARQFAQTAQGPLCVCYHQCVRSLVLAALGFSEESPKESCYQHIFYSSQTLKKDTLKQLESPGQIGRLSSLLLNRSPDQTKLGIVYSVHYLFPALNFTIVRQDLSLQSVWGALHNGSLAPPLTAIWVWESFKKTWCPPSDWPIVLMQWQHLNTEGEDGRSLHQKKKKKVPDQKKNVYFYSHITGSCVPI